MAGLALSAVLCMTVAAALAREIDEKELLLSIMVRSCCAFGCTARDTQESRKKGILFYRIPHNEEKRLLWLTAIRRKNFDPPPDGAICSQHFVGGKLLASIIIMHAEGRVWLCGIV